MKPEDVSTETLIKKYRETVSVILGQRDELTAERDALQAEVERLRADEEIAQEQIADLNTRATRAEKRAGRATAAVAAAMVEYQIHVQEFHPSRLHDGDCAGCRIGLVLSRERPTRPDDREEIERRITAPETPGDAETEDRP